MPVSRSNQSSLDLSRGVPSGPGTWSVPEDSGIATTAKYQLGDPTADRVFNGDGLNLSVEARKLTGSTPDGSLDRVDVQAGIEGLNAKVGLVRNGKADAHFEGLSL